MNRREAITNSMALAVGSLIPGTQVNHGQDLAKNRITGTTQVYTEHYLNDESSPICSVRLTVTLKQDAPSFWHPLDFERAAQWVANREKLAYKNCFSTFGPHDETKFKFE